jgi:alpha-L-arabinofuranosidase
LICALAGLNKWADEVILKVVNTAFVEQETDIRIAGVDKVRPTGTAIVLSPGKPTDENTLENPSKVSPVTHQFRSAAKGFYIRFVGRIGCRAVH